MSTPEKHRASPPLQKVGGNDPLSTHGSTPVEITKAEMIHLSFQSCCIHCLKNDSALACYIFGTHQLILIFSVDDKMQTMKYRLANISHVAIFV